MFLIQPNEHDRSIMDSKSSARIGLVLSFQRFNALFLYNVAMGQTLLRLLQRIRHPSARSGDRFNGVMVKLYQV